MTVFHEMLANTTEVCLDYFPLTNTASDPTTGAWRALNPGYTFVPNDGFYFPTCTGPTSFFRMFQGNTGFNDPDVSLWNTSNVTDMSRMFDEAEGFNQDISAWDTSNVTNMFEMFRTAIAFNQDISGWDTSNVTDMSFMFRSALAFNRDLSAWVTGLTAQPTLFSQGGNFAFGNNANLLKPFLSDGVTRVTT